MLGRKTKNSQHAEMMKQLQQQQLQALKIFSKDDDALNLVLQAVQQQQVRLQEHFQQQNELLTLETYGQMKGRRYTMTVQQIRHMHEDWPEVKDEAQEVQQAQPTRRRVKVA